MDEAECARAAAAGDVAAFTALVRLHEGAVRRFLSRLTRGNGADDLAQEVFVKAWRDAQSYRGDGSYRGWLLRIGWTLFLDARRGAGRRDAREQAYGTPSQAAPDPDLAIDVATALARLDPRARAAALLCYGEGCSHTEAAAILQMPLGTLKSIVARARSALAAELETADGR